MWFAKEYEAKVIITSKLKYFRFIKEKLNTKRRKLFRTTCFGKWLDLAYVDHEPHMIDYMLQRQCYVNDAHYDMPLIFYIHGRGLHFGRREFSLITGLLFGNVTFSGYSVGEVKLCSRLFPHRVGQKLTSLDLIGLIEDEELFSKISDDETVRVCMLLALEVIFIGHKLVHELDDTLLRLVENLESWNSFPWGEHLWIHLYKQMMNVVSNHNGEHLKGLHMSSKYVPIYTLYGFVWSFKIWILESFERINRWWTKDSEIIPRGLAWTRKAIFTTSDDPNPTIDLRPTIGENLTEWWTFKNEFLKNHIPNTPTRTPYIYDCYLNKVVAGRERKKYSRILISAIPTVPRSKISIFKDNVITALNSRIFKYEAIIQVLVGRTNGVLIDKLEFSDYYPNLGTDFCEELNKELVELFDYAISSSSSSSSDTDSHIDEADCEEYLPEEQFRMKIEADEMLLFKEEQKLEEVNKLRLQEEDMIKREQEKMRVNKKRCLKRRKSK